MDLSILITGAARGIGKACAEAFAEEGVRLFLAARTDSEALRAVRRSVDNKGASAAVFTGDLSDRETPALLYRAAEDFFGTPDVLVNNAGAAYTGLFQEMTEEDLFRLMNTDLLSVMQLTRLFLPGMIRRKSGRIINISSVFGRTGASCEAAYAAAKGGIDAFTRSLAKELAPSGIAVNAVAPGFIDTEMNGRLTPEEKAQLFEEIPAGRPGTPEEVAALVRFLAEAPLYLTGQVITIDGGWT